MEEVNYDVPDLWEISVEARSRGVLAKCVLEDIAENVGNVAQIRGLDTDGIEGPTSEVEFIAQAHVHIRHFGFRGLFPRPLG